MLLFLRKTVFRVNTFLKTRSSRRFFQVRKEGRFAEEKHLNKESFGVKYFFLKCRSSCLTEKATSRFSNNKDSVFVSKEENSSVKYLLGEI